VLKARGCRVVLDTSGTPLRLALTARPSVIKATRNCPTGDAVSVSDEGCDVVYIPMAGRRTELYHPRIGVSPQGIYPCS